MRLIISHFICALVLCIVTGCGGSNKVEIPKNPAPMPKNPQFRAPDGTSIPATNTGAAPTPTNEPARPPAASGSGRP
jgi:hypothetical protein